MIGKVYFWKHTNSYVVRSCDNLDNTSLVHTSRKRSGYVIFYDNTVNANININAAEENNNNWNTVLSNGNFTDCTIRNKRHENMDGIHENSTFKNISEIFMEVLILVIAL